MENFENTIHGMDTDLSEKFVVTACSDSIIRIFAIKDSNFELLSELSGHSGAVTQALFINQGELIASSDFDGKVIVWKLEGHSFVKKSETQVVSGPIHDISVRYSDSLLTVFCGCDNGILKTVSYDNNFKGTVTEQEIHRYGIISVSSTTDYIATGGLDCSVCLISKDGVEYFKHHQEAVNSVALSPICSQTKAILATCSKDGKLYFIQKENGNVQQQAIDMEGPCYSLDWSKTGLTLTVGYGKSEFKSFILGEDGKYQEIPMEKIEK